MSRVAFGRLVSLVTEKADESPFKVGLEAVEPATGKLAEVPNAEYSGEGIAFEPGDLLFGKLRPYLAKAWLADRPGAAVGDFHVYRCGPRLVPQYARWVVLANNFLDPVVSSVFGAKMPRASWDFVRTVEVHVPALAEQQFIADYLDRETAQIETLISEQKRLIVLLRERRTSLISLAALPCEREVARLGWYLRVSSGDGISIEDVDREEGDRHIPVIGGNGVMGYADHSNVYGPTIAIGRVGALCGNAHLVHEPAWITDNALRLDDVKDFDLEYLRWYLEGLNLNSLSRSTAQPLITGTQVAALRVPIMPVEDQRRIATLLADQTAKIDAMIGEVEQFIALSQERRSALITAAVTGQIDVRDEVA